MPTSNKIEVVLEIQNDQAAYLKKIAERFEFPDESKALRVLLDYAIRDADEHLIFAPENMRCRHCV